MSVLAPLTKVIRESWHNEQSSRETLPTSQRRVYIRKMIAMADIGQHTALATFICTAIDDGLIKLDTCPLGGGWIGSRAGLLAMCLFFVSVQ